MKNFIDFLTIILFIDIYGTFGLINAEKTE